MLRVDSPITLMDMSAVEDKIEIEKWNGFNHMCIMIMKRAILKAFKGSMSENTITTKEHLVEIEQRSIKNEKA